MNIITFWKCCNSLSHSVSHRMKNHGIQLFFVFNCSTCADFRPLSYSYLMSAMYLLFIMHRSYLWGIGHRISRPPDQAISAFLPDEISRFLRRLILKVVSLDNTSLSVDSKSSFQLWSHSRIQRSGRLSSRTFLFNDWFTLISRRVPQSLGPSCFKAEMTLYFVLILGPLTACLLQLATSLHVSNANIRLRDPSVALRQSGSSFFSQKTINSVADRRKTAVNLSRNHLTALKASSSSG